MNTLTDFHLPAHLCATAPPEARGLRRDGVRLLISHYLSDRFSHSHFGAFSQHLNSGDVLVLNTSATLPAALDVQHPDGRLLRLHLSNRLDAQHWIVELRTPDAQGASQPFAAVAAGAEMALPEGVCLRLLEPYRYPGGKRISQRLWLAELALPADDLAYLERHGRPIRYGYVSQDWPLSSYQTVYANTPGSAEMPSAGRALTPELLTRLMAQGVQVLPLVLHTGVSSLEAHELPYAEFFSVPEVTAEAVNRARTQGRRVVAVGTTAVRALESAANCQGQVQAGEGWTTLLITPERGLRVVNGLLTGLHEPEATHLAMLEALAGAEHIRHSYAAALAAEYLWHEFGDLHLLLP
ncbi:MAG: S-adenosylmethionine:tRNA ribosyltransferase-isomerase [Candidatus Sericytochromatia bacterium]